jgi:hypothetical protein
MRRRTLINGAVVSTVLLAAIGVGVAVASAATSTPSATTASISAGTSAGTSAGPTSSVTASSSPTASTSPSASSSSTGSSDGGSQCAKVYLVTKPAGDAVGELCAVVTASGTSISAVKITYTASSSCRGSVMLRVSGADQKGAEFDVVKTVSCSSGKATASFDPVSAVTSGSNVCGTLLSDTYTAALACVSIS